MHVLLSEFFRWSVTEDRLNCVPKHVLDMIADIHAQFDHPNNRQRVDDLVELFSDHIDSILSEFLNSACDKSPTFKLWFMLIQALQLILHNVKAEREGNWKLHLHTLAKIIPYFFVTNRTNYSRWAPVYLLDMVELPDEVHRYLDQGEFAVRQIPGRYNGIWSDMAVEKTVIKDSKGSGGITNITLQKSALVRWTLSRHVVADYANAMRVRSGINTDTEADNDHEQTQKSALKRDEGHVKDLISHIQERMTNPFDTSLHHACLINISTGMHSSPEVQKSLLSAVDQGEKQLEGFVKGA